MIRSAQLSKTISLIALLFFAVPASGQERAMVIKNVALFDGETYTKNVNLVCERGKIIDITAKPAQVKNAEIVDGAGKTIIPPLLNAHVHVWSADHLKEAINAGVFAVMDMHITEEAFHYLKDFKDSLHYASFYSSGPGATVPGGHGTQYGVPVPTINDSVTPQQFVENRVRDKVDYIKILREPMRSTLSFDQTKEIINTGHRHSKLVVTHVSRLGDAMQLADQNVDGFVHIWIDKPISTDQLNTLISKKTFIVPTLAVQQKLLAIGTKEGWAKYVLTFEKLLEETKKVYDSGLPILAGTDAPNLDLNYGTSFFEELLLLSKAGIPNLDVLRSATSNVYKSFKLTEFGQLKKGSPASFLLINGDPMSNIEDIQKVERIWKNGVRLK